MIHTVCSHCLTALTAQDQLAGHTMLCPVCRRPFVATPSPPPPGAQEDELPVTARVRSKQWSALQVIFVVAMCLLAIVICAPLLLCMGINSRAQKAQAMAAQEEEAFRKLIVSAVVQLGYTNVKMKALPKSHELGYVATATGYDKWGARHHLTMVFRYEDDTLEVLMLKEGDRLKTTSAIYEAWSNE